MSSPILQERTRQIAKELDGGDALKASNGWLQKLKARHNICYRVICGESAAASSVITNEWISQFASIVDEYNPSNIFNSYETSLFFKLLPDKSLVLSKEGCKRGKRSKDRFTVLLCVNWNDNEKLKPLVISKIIFP